MEAKTIQLQIDGQVVTVPMGTSVYHAALQAGTSLPIFCYQERMPPLGACRVCLVEVEGMHKLQTSCTLMAAEGMQVKTESEAAVAGRKDILEFLLINHPLDCPICDKGGECPLQDQTIRFGPGLSAFFEEKRHMPKAQPVTPILMVDQERCILCARCTRFGELIAGDHALEIFERGDRSHIGCAAEKSREAFKFLGNTIAICPVGALTSRVYRFRARPWDNAAHPTVCSLCPVGCSLVLDQRDGEIVRTRAGQDPTVNDMWLCDKGWFGYEHLKSDERLKEPLVKRGGTFHPISWQEAISLATDALKKSIPGKKIAGWGGSPLTIEENYLFQKLIREGCGVSHLEHRFGLPRLSASEEGLSPGMEGSIADLEQISWGWVFGVDITEEFPILWLRLQMAIQKGAALTFFGHMAPERRNSFEKEHLHLPGEEWMVIQKVIQEPPPTSKGGGALFVGGSYLRSLKRHHILAELLRWSRTHGVALHLLEAKNNSLGARLAGMLPDRGPFSSALPQRGFFVEEVLKTTLQEGWDFLYIAGVDLLRYFPTELLLQARKNLGFLLVQELFFTKTAEAADLVLPVLGFAEKKGTFCNLTGQARSWKTGSPPKKGCLADEEIFMRLGEKLGIAMEIPLEFRQQLHSRHSLFPQRPQEVQKGTVKELSPKEPGLLLSVVPRLFSHGERMQRNRHLFEMASQRGCYLNPKEAKHRGISSGDLCRLIRKGVQIEGEVEVSDRVPEGAVVLLQDGSLPIQEFGDIVVGETALEVEKR